MGIVPVGDFMMFPCWANAKALGRKEPFDAAVREIAHMPYLLGKFYHAQWGTYAGGPLGFVAAFRGDLDGRYSPRNMQWAIER